MRQQAVPFLLVVCCALGCGGSHETAADAGGDGGRGTDASRIVPPGDAGGRIGPDSTPGGDGASPTESGTGRDSAVDATEDAADGGVCGSFVADPGLAAKRAACAFVAGDKVATTLDDASSARAAIKNILIVAHENRSFDHLYGTLGAGFAGFPATYTNPTADGGVAYPEHAPTACPADISHSPAAITAEWNDGGMNGFLRTDGAEALWYYDTSDHPFYSWLMTTFAASDSHFCSALGHTGDNRRFLYGASETQTASNIFTEMDAAGVKWANYYAGADPIYNTYSWPVGYPNTYPYSQFLPDLDTGKLPAVTYVDTDQDEHPPGSMKSGEAVIYTLLEHAFASPLWPNMAIVFTYDEGGGFFDHVPPPATCAPSTSAADQAFKTLGIRVPLMIFSPFARKAYVSHVVHSHTSVMRLVELLHDLPAVTARDANSDALLDMFDFACPAFVSPPVLPAPPDGGCP